MNFKINKEEFKELMEFRKDKFLFGSRLHELNNEESDHDYIIMLDDRLYDLFETKAKYLPNVHSFQFDDTESNIQYVLMTERQFYNGLFTGDGNMIADVVLFDDRFENDKLILTSGYKTIKGYLGVANRDLRMHPMDKKKQLHAIRSLYIAGKLIKNNIPTIEDMVHLHDKYSKVDINVKGLNVYQKYLRGLLNDKLDRGEIDLYPNFSESNEIADKLNYMNNIKSFKY